MLLMYSYYKSQVLFAQNVIYPQNPITTLDWIVANLLDITISLKLLAHVFVVICTEYWNCVDITKWI